MKSVLFSIVLNLLLPFLLAHKKMCYTCHGVNSETCKDVVKECPHSDCMTVSEEFGDTNHTAHSVFKRCANNLPCNDHFYVYSGQDIWIYYYIQCCKEEKCNTGYYHMPKIEKQEEGILCPACFEKNTLDGCNATKSSVCLGKDDQCASFRGTIKPPGGENMNISGKGCGSKLACQLDYSSLIGMRVPRQLEYKCYVPTSPASYE